MFHFRSLVIVSPKYLSAFTFLELAHEKNNQFRSENSASENLKDFHYPSLHVWTCSHLVGITRSEKIGFWMIFGLMVSL